MELPHEYYARFEAHVEACRAHEDPIDVHNMRVRANLSKIQAQKEFKAVAGQLENLGATVTSAVKQQLELDEFAADNPSNRLIRYKRKYLFKTKMNTLLLAGALKGELAYSIALYESDQIDHGEALAEVRRILGV